LALRNSWRCEKIDHFGWNFRRRRSVAGKSIGKGCKMARLTWHAYYFDSLDRKSPIARMAIIEADNEDDAGKIAIAQMGRCMRVDVARPMWGAPVLQPRAPSNLANGATMLASA
jgi:hypothetical protein